jgi:3-deoxy-D-manno-octulosonic-acid transferase
VELVTYRALTRLARPAAGLILRLRERRGKEDPARRGERFGAASAARPDGPLAWVHAASVGETSAVLPLIAALRARRSDLSVLLTTGTVTSARFIGSRRPDGVRHQYLPLDSPAFVARFLDHWRPDLAVFTEQEVWPNLVVEASARSVPLALVNARMSDRSFERWLRRASLANALFSRFTIVLAQNAILAERFRLLGAGEAVAAGNLKIDAPPPPVDAAARGVLAAALADRPRLVAASTHAGEEAVVAEAHREIARHVAGFCTIIAPRHPERGPGVAEALRAAGFTVARRSLGELPEGRTDIYIADTIGELGTLYSIAPLGFIGGSLVPHGGQNPIEAVRHGAVVLTGPHWTNFADAYRALIDGGAAIEVRTNAELAAEARRLTEDGAALARLKGNAERALATLSGALDRCASALLPLIAEPAAGPSRSRTGAA